MRLYGRHTSGINLAGQVTLDLPYVQRRRVLTSKSSYLVVTLTYAGAMMAALFPQGQIIGLLHPLSLDSPRGADVDRGERHRRDGRNSFVSSAALRWSSKYHSHFNRKRYAAYDHPLRLLSPKATCRRLTAAGRSHRFPAVRLPRSGDRSRTPLRRSLHGRWAAAAA